MTIIRSFMAAICTSIISSASASALRSWALSRVAAVRRASASDCPGDSDADRAYCRSWKESRVAVEEVLFSRQSEMAQWMQIQVRQRASGWRTLSLVGPERHIMHGVVKVDSVGCFEPSAVPTEYIKSLAAVGLAGLSPACSQPRCLFLGYGAGTLPLVMGAHLPDASALTAIEMDEVVLAAAATYLGLNRTRTVVIVADAIAWVHAQHEQAQAEEWPAANERQGEEDQLYPRTSRPASSDVSSDVAASPTAQHGAGFDAVFIDLFDGHNDVPPAAYSAAFLRSLSGLLRPGGVVVHNFHFGSKALNATLRAAEGAYQSAFPSACVLAALDSRPWAGNAIIAASIDERSAYCSERRLAAAAAAARERFALLFDAKARCRGARSLLDDS